MEYLKIGLIKKTHGLRGELKIFPLTDEPSRYKSIKNIFIKKDDLFNKYTIKSVKETPNDIIVKLFGIESIEEAESFKNCYIYIDRDDGLALNDWEYYSEDIVGCEVLYNNKLMGIVVDLVNFGANDNLVIKYNSGEFFFPFSRSYIDRIDLESKKIYINQIEGFFD
jgi:16S rRNA processing protein RimM